MHRLLPVSKSSISRVLVHTMRLAPLGVSRSFSTTVTTAHYEQRSRKPDGDREQVERTERDFKKGTAQPSTPTTGRTPRHSLSDARHGPSPYAQQGAAHHPHRVNISVPDRASSIRIQKKESHGYDRVTSGGSGTQSGPRSASDAADTFRLLRTMSHRPAPLGTLPRTKDYRIQDNIEDAQLNGKIGGLGGRGEDTRNGAIAGSLRAIEQLPIHPDLLKAILSKPELYGATPAETEAFRCISSGKDVFIRLEPNSNPAHILPLVQKVINSREKLPGSSFVQTATATKFFAKTRPISILILTSQSLENAMSFYAAKKLLRNFPDIRVASALYGKSAAIAQQRILEGCDILVAHPAMLAHLMDKATQRGEIRRKLETLQALVVEDAAVFVDLQCEEVLSYIINEVSRKNRDQRPRPQGVVVSTSGLEGPVKKLAHALLSPQHEHIDERRNQKAQSPPLKRYARG